MQIDFLGANCLRLKSGGTTLVFDDNLASLGGQGVAGKNDIVCLTNDGLIAEPPAAKIVFNTPGSYEVSEILIDAVRADSFLGGDYPHATVYKVVCEDINLAVTGHIQPKLSDVQLEELGLVDVLFVPVGGNGYTLDATAALQLTKSIDPKLVIPTHYEQKGLKYEVPQQSCEEFIKLAACETSFVEGSLKLKRGDFGEQLSLKVFKNS